MAGYQIFTDATADFNVQSIQTPPFVHIIPMQLTIGGETYTYGPGGTIDTRKFYAMQRAGAYAATTQIAPDTYFRHFEPALRAGLDILYLGFSSAMSGTFQTARLCARELREQYPGRKIVCVDTRCASVGEGLLVCEAARRQAEGYSLEQLANWAACSQCHICHWFTVDVLDHLRHGGRISSAAAAFGTALQIKPLLHVDPDGRLAVLEKPRGRKQAIRAQLTRMEASWAPEIGTSVNIGHGDCLEAAQQLEEAVRRQFPQAKTEITDIGPIIGAHTGPGMLAVAHWGSIR